MGKFNKILIDCFDTIIAMGNLLQKKQQEYKRLPDSIWNYRGSELTISGLCHSSYDNKDGTFLCFIYHQDKYGLSRKCVFMKQFSFCPTGTEVTFDERRLIVHFMDGETRVGEPVVWNPEEYALDSSCNIETIEKKNDVVSSKKRESPNMGTVDMTSALNSGHVISHRGIFCGANAEKLPSRSFLGAGEVPAGELDRIIPSEDAVFADVTTINMDDLCPSSRSQAVISSEEVQQTNTPFWRQTAVLQETLSMALGSSEKNVFQESPMTGPALEISQTIGESAKDISHIEQCFGAIGMKTPLQEFCGLRNTFNVSADSKSITYMTESGKKFASLGIPREKIKRIYVLPVCWNNAYLIVIHGQDCSLSIFGYSKTRTSTSFTPIQVTPFECYNKTTPVVFDKLMFDSDTVFIVYLSNKTSRKYSINLKGVS